MWRCSELSLVHSFATHSAVRQVHVSYRRTQKNYLKTYRIKLLFFSVRFLNIFNNMSTKIEKMKFCFSDRCGRSGIESRWGRDFPPVLTGPGAHPASCKMDTGSFPGVKCGRGVLLTTHPLLVPRSWKSRAIPLTTLWAIPGL